MLRSLAPLLGCGVMMLVCMAVMALAGARNRDTQSPPHTPASTDEIAALREEDARLRALDDERGAADEPAP
ncbi:MAG: hypothetical protein ACRD29_01200 [Acidimicrobiales bacterium]